MALRAENLSKGYKLYDSPRTRLKALLTGRSLHRDHWALAGVSFTLARGQCMGLVGDNGAGKSTLLKLAAGTLRPTTGRIAHRGRVTAILELGAGFHPEFSGRDNLYFGGALIGIPERKMTELEESIIAFAELEEAIDRPVKTYSSGMVVRLAFALVTAVEPEVLIIDEALAVGDQHFQKKCVERITAFRHSGCTILFCSHSLYHIRQLCDVTLWLDGGRPKGFGPTEQVLTSYEAHVRALDDASVSAPRPVLSAPLPLERRAGIVDVSVAGLESTPAAGQLPLLESRDLVVTMMAYVQDEEQPCMGMMLEQVNGVGVTSVGTHVDGVSPVRMEDGRWRATVVFPDLPLSSGDYVVSVYLFDSSGIVVYDEWYECVHFKFISPIPAPGLVHLPHRWS